MEQSVKPKNAFMWVLVVLAAITLLLGLIMGGMAAFKTYNVWGKQQTGKAALAEAEFSKQVQVEQAKANLEAEKLNALSEIERAKGAAESIKVEAGGLTEQYIRYLWVRQLDKINEGTVIYIPTDAGLPVLEAGKR